MNDRLTEIAFVLDRSGSMQSMAEHAIAGFNGFLRDQQHCEGEARMTLVLFDDLYEVLCASFPVREVAELDTTTFVPRGSTALLDAIGRTVEELGARLAAMPEADRPGQVIVAILTDGFENASKHFTWHKVQDMIRHQEQHYSWQFLFLGANADSIASAAKMGIAAGNTAQYVHDARGIEAARVSISKKVRGLRLSKLGDKVIHPDAAKPLEEILREEDGRPGGQS